jgi:hypothetical protein
MHAAKVQKMKKCANSMSDYVTDVPFLFDAGIVVIFSFDDANSNTRLK